MKWSIDWSSYPEMPLRYMKGVLLVSTWRISLKNGLNELKIFLCALNVLLSSEIRVTSAKSCRVISSFIIFMICSENESHIINSSSAMFLSLPEHYWWNSFFEYSETQLKVYLWFVNTPDIVLFGWGWSLETLIMMTEPLTQDNNISKLYSAVTKILKWMTIEPWPLDI